MALDTFLSRDRRGNVVRGTGGAFVFLFTIHVFPKAVNQAFDIRGNEFLMIFRASPDLVRVDKYS